VLEVVDDEEFLAAVAAKGRHLAAGLRELPVDVVRGRGLMLAFDVDDAPDVARRLLLDQKLVVNATGPRTIRLLPALTVSDDEIDDALGRLRAVVAA
jgi:acetylornithine/succinyldiaminopimelate/putrescine aminotransferase